MLLVRASLVAFELKSVLPVAATGVHAAARERRRTHAWKGGDAVEHALLQRDELLDGQVARFAPRSP